MIFKKIFSLLLCIVLVFSANLDVQKSEDELVAYLEEMKIQENL